jgi:hypothetical protein
MLLALEVFYILTIGVFKVSIGLFFVRILTEKWQRGTIYCVLVIFSTFGVVYFFYAIFQCGIPTGSTFWQRRVANQCLSNSSGLGLGYTHGVLTALTDLIFVALPLWVVFKARLNLRERIIISGIMLLAIV